MSRPRNPRRAEILAAILKGEPTKTVADAGGMSQANACKWACYLGFRKLWITDDERREIMARRQQRPALYA